MMRRVTASEYLVGKPFDAGGLASAQRNSPVPPPCSRISGFLGEDTAGL
jgi:hypothetical protein